MTLLSGRLPCFKTSVNHKPDKEHLKDSKIPKEDKAQKKKLQENKSQFMKNSV
jgi:hypothetical protein